MAQDAPPPLDYATPPPPAAHAASLFAAGTFVGAVVTSLTLGVGGFAAVALRAGWPLVLPAVAVVGVLSLPVWAPRWRGWALGTGLWVGVVTVLVVGLPILY